MGEEFAARDPDFERRTRESFVRQAFMAELGAEMRAVEPGRVEIALAGRGDQVEHGADRS